MFQPVPEMRGLKETTVGFAALIAIFVGALVARLTVPALVYAGVVALGGLLWGLWRLGAV